MTDEAKALVERLRDSFTYDQQHYAPDPLVAEAADLIEEQDRHLTLSGKVSKALSERIEALEAEIGRLRAALERIANGNGIGGPDAELQCADIARAALAGDSHDQF